MIDNTKVVGVVLLDNEFKFMVQLENNFQDKNVKEIAYADSFGAVESFFGFTDLKFKEVDADDERVHAARIFLSEEKAYCKAVVFLEDDGFLCITDLVFFSAYTRYGDKVTPYTTTVESDCYDDDVSSEMLGTYFRLN